MSTKDECIKIAIGVNTIKYYLVFKKEDNRAIVTTWINLKNIIKWNNSDSETQILYDFICV
jgi:heme-degrading monooxygenase HmoA